MAAGTIEPHTHPAPASCGQFFFVSTHSSDGYSVPVAGSWQPFPKSWPQQLMLARGRGLPKLTFLGFDKAKERLANGACSCSC